VAKKKPTRPAKAAVSYERIHEYREQGHDVGPKGAPDIDKVNRVAEIKQVLQGERLRGEGPATGRNEWKVRADRADALRKEMELKKELGQLVEVAEVRASGFKIGRQIRDGMLNIPDRLSTLLAAETDPKQIHAMLVTEIRQVLEVLADAGRE
jgi:hypothetical protein